MKKFRILLAVIATVAMLFSVVSADNSAVNFGATTVEYKDLAEKLVISVYAGIDATFAGGSAVGVGYETDKWVYESYVNSDKVSGSTAVNNGDYISVSVTANDGNDTAVTTGMHLMDIVFVPAEGMTLADLDGSEFTFYDDGALFDDGYNSPVYSGSIKVVAAKSETLTEATYVNADTNELTLISPATGKETTYTNVPVFKGSAAGNFKLRAAYGDDQTHDLNNGETFDVKNFTTVNNGGLEFQVAIVGVPKDITITTLYVVE